MNDPGHLRRMLRIRKAHGLIPALSIGAVTIATISLCVVWIVRYSSGGNLYVSGYGAPSMPLAHIFNTALLGIGISGVLVSLACPTWYSDLRILKRWSASSSILASGLAFIVASRITCTDGCPIPFTEGSTLQDLIHIAAAAIGFTSASIAMLQVATSEAASAIRNSARFATASISASSLAGAGLSVSHFHADWGANMEFMATTIGVMWLASIALAALKMNQMVSISAPQALTAIDEPARFSHVEGGPEADKCNSNRRGGSISTHQLGSARAISPSSPERFARDLAVPEVQTGIMRQRHILR